MDNLVSRFNCGYVYDYIFGKTKTIGRYWPELKLDLMKKISTFPIQFLNLYFHFFVVIIPI